MSKNKYQKLCYTHCHSTPTSVAQILKNSHAMYQVTRRNTPHHQCKTWGGKSLRKIISELVLVRNYGPQKHTPNCSNLLQTALKFLTEATTKPNKHTTKATPHIKAKVLENPAPFILKCPPCTHTAGQIMCRQITIIMITGRKIYRHHSQKQDISTAVSVF